MADHVKYQEAIDKARAKARAEEPRLTFAMFGIECHAGWARLYGPLIELCNKIDVTVNQVKEKYGTLRFYTGGSPDWLFDIIDCVEADSQNICEDCGIRNGGYRDRDYEHPVTVDTKANWGWVRTQCEKCRAELVAKREAEWAAKREPKND